MAALVHDIVSSALIVPAAFSLLHLYARLTSARVSGVCACDDPAACALCALAASAPVALSAVLSCIAVTRVVCGPTATV